MLPILLCIFKKDVQCVYLVCWVTVNSSHSSFAASPLLDGLCGCCALWATSCSPTTCRLQWTIFTSWQTWYETKKSPVSLWHLLLFWNPRPGVRQTSDPHSVCQIWALVLVCSCSIFWLLCFQDLRLYSHPWMMLHVFQVTNPDTFKHVISIRKIDQLNYK